MVQRNNNLSGFAQIHIYLYSWELSPIESITKDFRILTPDLFDKNALENILRGLQMVDTRLINESENDFVVAHRLIDVVAIRYVRNEHSEASGWSEWQGCHEQKGDLPFVRFGHATLLQCESDTNGLNEEELRLALNESIVSSTYYSRLSLAGCTVLPFGYLFEFNTAETVWLLINKPGDEKAARWMTVDWLRLTTFLKKHSHYVQLFEQEMEKMEKIITAIEEGDISPQFDSERASILLERSRDRCEAILNNIIAAEKGYANSLEDTFGITMSSLMANKQYFLHRILGQIHLASEMSRRHLKSLRDRWPGVERSIRVAIPKVQGDLFWSHPEEVTIARYFDCRCNVVQSVLNEIIKWRGQGFGPDKPENVARDIYNWLREYENIIYDFEPVQPHRRAQLIREHCKAIITGTCIDLSCLYAALLEGGHQCPVLVHYLTWVGPSPDDWEAHMVCGLWLNDTAFSGDGLRCKDVDELRGHIRDGSLLLVECMGFSKGEKRLVGLDITFEDAKERSKREALGRSSPIRTFNFAIDIKRCRDFDIQAIQQD